VFTNATARIGDALVLTKPLGTGIIVRATRFGQGTPEHLDAAVRSMKQLNDVAAAAAGRLPAGDVSACTDVTGFGLAGHSCEMASASGVMLEITAQSLPVLPGALALVQEFLPCGGRANLKHFTGFEEAPRVSPEWTMVCQDPQTSGGLLLAIRPEKVAGYVKELAAAGVTAAVIGRVAGPCVPDGPLVRLI
jgi:selenide,water dikinase